VRGREPFLSLGKPDSGTQLCDKAQSSSAKWDVRASVLVAEHTCFIVLSFSCELLVIRSARAFPITSS